MISAVAWVRKGAAQRVPDRYEMSDEDLGSLHQLTAKELAAAREEYRRATGADVAADALSDMDDDDDDDEEEEEEDSDAAENNSLFARVKGLAYYNGNEEDPYITFRTPTGAPQSEALTAEEEELHRADLEVLPTDNLLLAARTEDEVSHLEVCVYEGEDVGNLYVRHDVMLPAFPLCLEWLDFRVGRKKDLEGGGNYVAVGTFDPEIEIWDLDTTEAMYPDAILGRTTAQEETCANPSKGEKKKKKKKKKAVSNSANKERHVDAVLGLAWNHNHRNLLASASADMTVKLWDLRALRCSHSYEHHSDKVQAVRWHPTEGPVLLTGSFDKTVAALDSRKPADVARWTIGHDVEAVRWDYFVPHLFYVSNESGTVQCFDARSPPAAGSGRKPSAAVFTLDAHDDDCSAMDLSPVTRGLMATGSSDKIVKLWDVMDGRPKMVLSRNLGVGKVFTVAFSPDSPMTLAAAGSAGKTQVWDASANAGARLAFAGRATLPPAHAAGAGDRQEVVGLADDAEESDDEEGVVGEIGRIGAPASEDDENSGDERSADVDGGTEMEE